MINIVRFLLVLYRKLVSPTLPKSCRFYPSCSQYAIEAIDQHGSSAILLIIKRIFKCHPFHSGGFDPVPSSTRRN
ncbi:MAG: membrane protein insertion efficiency factor YidD [Candidatus Saganbacteria bacterium]|nr:membrane protein insertion efficiency factor YidD [Candidatus Saganbacteria bacterium]